MNTFALGGRFFSALGRGRGIPVSTPSFIQQSTNDPFVRYFGNESRGRGTKLNNDLDRNSFGKGNTIGEDLFSVLDTQKSPTKEKNSPSSIAEILKQEPQTNIIPEVLSSTDDKQVVVPPRGRSAKSLAPHAARAQARRDESEVDKEKEEAEEKEEEDEMDVEVNEAEIKMDSARLQALIKEYESVPYTSLTPFQKSRLRELRIMLEHNDAQLNEEYEARIQEGIKQSNEEIDDEDSDFFITPSELSKYGDSDPELTIRKGVEIGENLYNALLDNTAAAYKKIWTRKEEVAKIRQQQFFKGREMRRQQKAKRKEQGLPEKVKPQPMTTDEVMGLDLEYLIRDVPAEHPVHAFARMLAQNPTIPLPKKRIMVQSYIRELDKAQKKFQTLSPTGASLYGVKKVTVEEIETS